VQGVEVGKAVIAEPNRLAIDGKGFGPQLAAASLMSG